MPESMMTREDMVDSMLEEFKMVLDGMDIDAVEKIYLDDTKLNWL